MTNKLLISRRDDSPLTLDNLEANFDFQIESISEQRALVVENRPSQLETLQQQGYRVKRLLNTNLLNISQFSIDIETEAPAIEPTLEVPSELSETWPQSLIQFISYPEQEWLSILESHGVTVLDPLPPYGYVVKGSPSEIQSLENLSFVAWVGPFQPAYRLSANLSDLTGRVQYVGTCL